jgi:hypothetical protein
MVKLGFVEGKYFEHMTHKGSYQKNKNTTNKYLYIETKPAELGFKHTWIKLLL